MADLYIKWDLWGPNGYGLYHGNFRGHEVYVLIWKRTDLGSGAWAVVVVLGPLHDPVWQYHHEGLCGGTTAALHAAQEMMREMKKHG